MLDANFWQDKDNSKKVIKEKKLYEDLVNSLNQSIQKLNDFDDSYVNYLTSNYQELIDMEEKYEEDKFYTTFQEQS